MSEGGHRASDWVHGEFRTWLEPQFPSRTQCAAVPTACAAPPTKRKKRIRTEAIFFSTFFRVPLQRKCPHTVSTAPNFPT